MTPYLLVSSGVVYFIVAVSGLSHPCLLSAIFAISNFFVFGSFTTGWSSIIINYALSVSRSSTRHSHSNYFSGENSCPGEAQSVHLTRWWSAPSISGRWPYPLPCCDIWACVSSQGHVIHGRNLPSCISYHHIVNVRAAWSWLCLFLEGDPNFGEFRSGASRNVRIFHLLYHLYCPESL